MNKQELKSFIQAEIARIERNKNMTEGDVMRIQSHRITLASLEAQPVYWEIAGQIFSTQAEALAPGYRGTPEPLYEEPPVPVDLAALVPDAVNYDDLDTTSKDREIIRAIAECKGWNAHRAEVLRRIEKLEG